MIAIGLVVLFVTNQVALADIPALSNSARPSTFEAVIEIILSSWPFLIGTLALELPIYYLSGVNSKKGIWIAALASVISVPFLAVARGMLVWPVFFVELGIILFEGVFIGFLVKNISVWRGLKASLVANVFSAVIGVIVLYILFPPLNSTLLEAFVSVFF
jgi:hypothetical protein